MIDVTTNYKNYNLSNLMTAKELKDYLKIGKNAAYALINNDEVPVVRIGNKKYVVVDRLQEYLHRNLR